jgi:uncharacterized protein (DUF305 family)
MKRNVIVIGLVALIIGAGGGYALAMSKAPQPVATTGGHMMPDGSMMGGSMNSGMQGQMDSMMQSLNGKTGDAFDQAFLTEMIMHHQGAVVMAEAALQNAKHQEIKDLAKNIISAQNTEIKEMQDWKAAWYGQ